MCNCKGKCGCNISTITKGEKGDSGNVSASFYAFKAQTVTNPSTIDVETTVAADGDYIVQLEMTLTNNDAGDIGVVTSALKNSVLDSLNDNYEHAADNIPTGSKITYTHTAKITGLTAGQKVGFQLSSDASFIANNGSLTIFKV